MEYASLVIRVDASKCPEFMSLTIENYFQYNPNFFAAVFFATLFGLLAICTIIQVIYYKAGYMWVMAMGATCTIVLFLN